MVDVPRSCEKCAFYNGSFEVYGNSMGGICSYINVMMIEDRLAGMWNVDKYAICDHFVSAGMIQKLKLCESDDERKIMLDVMYSSCMDDSLITELADGLSEDRKQATAKMMSYADRIERELMNDAIKCSYAGVVDASMLRPPMIMMNDVDDAGVISHVRKSDDFKRTQEYINANKHIVQREDVTL